MKSALFLIVFWGCLLSGGQPRMRTSITGADHAYRGYDFWFRVGTGWFNSEPMTVNTATDYVTVNTRTYNGAEGLVVLADGGSLPSAISAWGAYKACFIDGHSFKFVSTSIGGCENATNFTDTGSGQLYVGTSTTGPASSYMEDLELPPGVTLVEVHDHAGNLLTSVDGRYMGSTGSFAFYILLHAETYVPLTPQTIRVTVGQNGEEHVYTKAFQAKALTPIATARPSSFPPVPNKTNWEAQMLARAAQWCPDRASGRLNPPTLTIGPSGESQVWYYDGAWVYEQVASYTKDPSWSNCAQSIRSQYRNYVMNVRVPHAYQVFTDGLKSIRVDANGEYAAAIKRIADLGQLVPSGGNPRDDYNREVSYLLETALNAAHVYGYTSLDQIPSTGTWPTIKKNILRSSAMLLGFLDIQRGDNYIYQQTFMTGLTMRALIRYYEYTGDPRVPVEIKATLDQIWNELWLPASTPNTLIYNKAPRGARCLYSCNPYGETTLINMTVPAFAWYWSITGDNTYRVRGDTIWSHALDQRIDWSGKLFSQNYRWSFDYVYWREGRRLIRP